MKYINGVFWPEQEEHLTSVGLGYQEEIRSLAMSVVHPSKRKLAIDIGAHVGIATLHFAANFDRIIAYEPIPETFECLQKNTEGLNVELRNVALADTSTTIGFNLHHGNTGYTEPDTNGTGFVTSFLDAEQIPCTCGLVKIDVEGFESLVIKGGEAFFKNHKPVVILEAKGIGYDAKNPVEPLRLLCSYGYGIATAIGNDYLLAPLELFVQKDTKDNA